MKFERCKRYDEKCKNTIGGCFLYFWWLWILVKYIFHGFLIVLMIDLQQIFSILLAHDFKNNLDTAWKKKDVCFARSVTK